MEEAVLKMVKGRWKLQLIRELLRGVRRFSELQRLLGGVTHKILAHKLRELEKDGIVHREVHASVPSRVDYSLTPAGRELQAVLDAMQHWGIHHLDEQAARDSASHPGYEDWGGQWNRG